MPRRDTVLGADPLGFEQGELGQAHENRVERAGLQSRFAAQLISIAPSSRALGEPFKHTTCLGGYSRNLHLSTYSPATIQPRRSQYSCNSRNCISGNWPFFDPMILAYRAVRVMLWQPRCASCVQLGRSVPRLAQLRVLFRSSFPYLFSLGNLGTPADIRFALAFASSLRRFCWPSCIRNSFFVGIRPPPWW